MVWCAMPSPGWQAAMRLRTLCAVMRCLPAMMARLEEKPFIELPPSCDLVRPHWDTYRIPREQTFVNSISYKYRFVLVNSMVLSRIDKGLFLCYLRCKGIKLLLNGGDK